MGTKVDKEDPTDLLPKVTAEKMTWRLLRGCQLKAALNKKWVNTLNCDNFPG